MKAPLLEEFRCSECGLRRDGPFLEVLFKPCNSQHIVCWPCSLRTVQLFNEEQDGVLRCPFPECTTFLTIEDVKKRFTPRCLGCTIRLPRHSEDPLYYYGCQKHYYCEECFLGDLLENYLIKNFYEGDYRCPFYTDDEKEECSFIFTRAEINRLKGKPCLQCGLVRGFKSACLKGEDDEENCDHFICGTCLDNYFNKNTLTLKSADKITCPASSSHVLSEKFVVEKLGEKCLKCLMRKTGQKWKKFSKNCHYICDSCLLAEMEPYRNFEVAPIFPCFVCQKPNQINNSALDHLLGNFCIICLERKGETSSSNGRCKKHFSCKTCLTTYVLTTMSSDLSPNVLIPCPGGSCENNISLSEIQDIVGYTQLQQWLWEKFALENRLKCQNDTCLSHPNLQLVSSATKHSIHDAKVELYCTSCEIRSCLVCRQVLDPQLLEHVCADPADASLLLSLKSEDAQVKPCPNCLRLINRYTGCLHMTCGGLIGCKYEFCWLCLEKYSPKHNCRDKIPEVPPPDPATPPPPVVVNASTPYSSHTWRRKLRRLFLLPA